MRFRSLATRALPILQWLPQYRRQYLSGDVTAGLVIAVILVPQAMAYAYLAGMPPEAGLYASTIPLLLYAVFASSRHLSLGPTAVVSLMTFSAASELAPPGTQEYVTTAVTLALLTGALMVAMGLLRLGVLANLLGQPILLGFITAAAVLILLSQAGPLLGIPLGHGHAGDLILELGAGLADLNGVTACLGALGIILIIASRFAGRLMAEAGSPKVGLQLGRIGPLIAVLVTTTLVALFRMDREAGVSVVGEIPGQFPELALPWIGRDAFQALLPAALLIALVGFAESVSVAKSLAGRTRSPFNANQEFAALGAANIASACAGGFPVAASITRTAGNYAAGAQTQVAGLVTACIVASTAIQLSPLLYYMPQAVLASIIVVAVVNLVDWHGIRTVLHYSRFDATVMVTTFCGVLVIGIEQGLVIGLVMSVATLLWRTSRPSIVEVGRLPGTSSYRSTERFTTTTSPHIVAIRIDEGICFANVNHIHQTVLSYLASRPDLRDMVLVCAAVNTVDVTGRETLQQLVEQIHECGVRCHLADVKSSVAESLRRSGIAALLDERGGRIFVSTDEAMVTLDPRRFSSAQPAREWADSVG